ncbi:unnamed protein product [Agarophyton chilense]
MTLCPYKWFLYIASVWAVLYVMVEAWMHMRNATKQVDEYQQQTELEDDDDSDEEEEEEEEEEKESRDVAYEPLLMRASLSTSLVSTR